MENIIQLWPKPTDTFSNSIISKILRELEEVVLRSKANIDLKKIKINTQESIHFLDPAQIIRCEASGNYCKIYTMSKGSLLVSKTLKSIYELLPKHHFVRTHQSHVINVNFISKISKIDGVTVELESGELIPISRAEKNHVINCLS